MPVSLQIAETSFSSVSKKGKKTCSLCDTSVLFFVVFHSCFAALWLVVLLLWRLTATQQSSRASISERQAQSELKRPARVRDA